MIQTAINAFNSIGLLAIQVLKFHAPEMRNEIRIGEVNWSCRLALACEEMGDEEDISIKHIWVVVKEGPQENEIFRLDTLLKDESNGIRRILGSHDTSLRNNMLEHLHRYNKASGSGEIVLQDMNSAPNGVLKGFGYDQTWNAYGKKVEELDEDLDAIVFPISDNEDTKPWPIPETDQTAVYSTTGSQQMN